MKKILIAIGVLLVGMVIGWLCRGYHFREEVKMVQKDTIVYRDTIRESYPLEINKEVVRKEYVIVRDTVRIKDTLYLSLPMERRVYGSDDFYAEVTGYKPSLDYIEVFPKTTIITEKIAPERKRNTIGIGVDVGYMNSLSLPIYLEYERMLHKNVGINAQIFYDLPTRQVGVGLGVKAQIEW